MSAALTKGPRAEEVLRNYFINLGYFVVRGCKYRFAGFDVTDIDLWLYGKKSALTRELLNVDAKNKKTPQALERIFWAKGLQRVLGFDGCIVGTTESRKEVREFGRRHNVTVLDGSFLSRLMKSDRSQQNRITEEDLLSQAETQSLGRLGGDWRGRYEASKSRLLDSLSFDGCNIHLDDVRYFLEQLIQKGPDNSVALRLTYLAITKLLVALDYILAQQVAADQNERRQLLDEGFRYGSSGKAYTEKVGRLASALVTNVLAQTGGAVEVERALREQALSLRADLLAEYFGNGVVCSALFDLAREIEKAGFAVQVPRVVSLSPAAQSTIGVLADFHGIDRKRVIT